MDKTFRLSSETHCSRWQSALAIMTDFGWNWLPTCDDKLFNFAPAQRPLVPLRRHFASSSSGRAAPPDSVIRILNQAKLRRYLGATCKLLWHSTMWNPNICCCCCCCNSHRHYCGHRQGDNRKLFSRAFLGRMAEANIVFRNSPPDSARDAWHSAGHGFAPSHFSFFADASVRLSRRRYCCLLLVKILSGEMDNLTALFLLLFFPLLKSNLALEVWKTGARFYLSKQV